MYGKKSLTMIIIKLGWEEGADNYACAQLNIFASHKIKIHYFLQECSYLGKKNYKLLQVLIVNGYNSVEKRNVITWLHQVP